MRNLDTVFARLAASAFRSRFRLAARERDYMRAKNIETVLAHAHGFVAERLANDGKQTPFRGHPVFVAQHATATCCRGCLSKWHGIPAGRPLTADEQGHVLAAIGRWLDMQFSTDGTGAQQSLPLP